MIANRNATCWMLVLLGLLLQGQAMAFTQTLYLFSEVEGTVLLDGQPVEGVEVGQEYHWHWKNEHRKSSTKTGANGRFHFPAVTGKSLTAGLIPHEPAIGQRITLRYQGKEHKGWVFSKHNYDNLGEVKGRALTFNCELNAEPVAQAETETFGICLLQHDGKAG
ncbi:DUF6795 domain-containing protein [Phytopseudomonas dryadis]|uniref:DUF6795 domain-containing protein n=1 Tax=Phytopseudomonas dryadis TaxID=2487520 RepID=A0ABY1Z3E4_9GAMM|nr:MULTISPECIES: DUF6795 domain-containing protein [Pseudomonas]TBV03260.1 hypothetical protein DNK34_16870 [Pseudomonas dryadis]TBV16366.1 hypothetical protein DNK41_15895 [Pseudomonas sp. FRB 230]